MLSKILDDEIAGAVGDAPFGAILQVRVRWTTLGLANENGHGRRRRLRIEAGATGRQASGRYALQFD